MEREKWIEIARTGTFTDSLGRVQTFTAADLAAIARSYDPEQRDAPLVFGHPQSDSAPAFGWVQKLQSEGEKLFASFAHVPSVVRDLVAQGHYRHVSMSLMPDRVTLRHVALLGAAQPAIDGLKAVELAEGTGAICIDCPPPTNHEGADMNPEELQRQIGQLQAQIEALKAENAALKDALEDSKEDMQTADSAKAAAEQKAAQANAEFAAYRGRVEKEQRESRVAALVAAGKVTPAEKQDVLAFAASLAGVAAPVEFSAGDGSTKSMSLEEKYFCD